LFKILWLVLSYPPPNPYEETGSGIPTDAYDGNRLSPPTPRQKMTLSGVWFLLTARWLFVDMK
jgi:hypothetical protein